MLSVRDLETFKSARSYKWEISFPTYSGRFFPATGFDDNLFNVTLGQLDTGPYPVCYFQSAEVLADVNLTVVVENDYFFVTWLLDWFSKIRKSDFRVAYMSNPDAVRDMIVHYLKLDNSVALTRRLKVTLSGDVSLPLSSESSSLTVSLPIKILGSDT